MDVVELFVAVSWSEEEGDDRVLGGEEEDNGKLSEGHET